MICFASTQFINIVRVHSKLIVQKKTNNAGEEMEDISSEFTVVSEIR